MNTERDMLEESIYSVFDIPTNAIKNTTVANLYDAQNDQFFTIVMPVSFDLAEEYMQKHYFDPDEPTGVFKGTPKSFEITIAELKTPAILIYELVSIMIEAKELHEEIALHNLIPCSY